MLTLSSLVKTSKRFSLDSSVSDEEFLNALLEPLVTAGRVHGRGGIKFHLDKSRTSQILNGKCDVPAALRKALPRFGIEDSVADEYSTFVTDSIDPSQFPHLANAIIAIASKDNESVRRLRKCLDDEERFMAISLLEAVKNDNRESYDKPLWIKGTGSLTIEVGDIFSHGFGRPRKMKQIVVIPVDTTFETKITWQYEEAVNPLISPKSLHGQWLIRMSQAGVSPEELDDRIESSLRRRSIQAAKKSRERAEYPIGTVAIIENARSLFYLLAISKLNDQNNAQSSSADIVHSVDKLLSSYDSLGQGFDIYIPLLGTGNSRANLTHQESLDLLTTEISKHKEMIHGSVNIVVFKDDAKKLVIPEREA